jgi:hypothetical protein
MLGFFDDEGTRKAIEAIARARTVTVVVGAGASIGSNRAGPADPRAANGARPVPLGERTGAAGHGGVRACRVGGTHHNVGGGGTRTIMANDGKQGVPSREVAPGVFHVHDDPKGDRRLRRRFRAAMKETRQTAAAIRAIGRTA